MLRTIQVERKASLKDLIHEVPQGYIVLVNGRSIPPEKVESVEVDVNDLVILAPMLHAG